MGIEFGKKYVVQTLTSLGDVGRDNIIRELYKILVYNYGKGSDLCCPICFERTFHAWSFVPVLKKGADNSGTYGKLSTRLSKHCATEYGVKLTPQELTELGNLINLYTLQGAQITLDFARDLNWQVGAFGDSGSCFWSKRKFARQMLMDNHAFAMRMWQNDKGVGRAWVWQHPSDNYIVFNGYGGVEVENGEHNAVESKKFAVLLADILHKQGEPASILKVALYNNGKYDEGLLWINNNTGYVVGDIDKFTDKYNRQLTEYDFKWPETKWRCNGCRNEFAWYTDIYKVNGADYCNYCYDDLFKSCDICGNVFSKSDMSKRKTHSNIYYVCQACNEVILACEVCGRLVKSENTVSVCHNGLDKRICNNHAYQYVKCITCGKLTNHAVKRCILCSVTDNNKEMYYQNPGRFDYLHVEFEIVGICSDECNNSIIDVPNPAYDLTNLKQCKRCDSYTNYILPDRCCASCTNGFYDSVYSLKEAGLL